MAQKESSTNLNVTIVIKSTSLHWRSKKNLETWIKGHCAGARNGQPEVSAAAEHVINKNHAVNWDQPQVIARDQHTKTHQNTQKHQALAIHTRKEHTMNGDTGLELSKLWLNFITKKREKKKKILTSFVTPFTRQCSHTTHTSLQTVIRKPYPPN